MENGKKTTKKKGISDDLSKMPKDEPYQRLRYLLKKYDMSQRELAKILKDSGGMFKEDTDLESCFSAINLKAKGHRPITRKDAENIAKVFPGTFPSFILYGGYENIIDHFTQELNELQKEGHLLDTAFSSLIALSGMKLKRFGLKTRDNSDHNGTIYDTLKSIYNYAIIEQDGQEYTLSHEQVNKLENIIFEHAEITIRHYLEAFGREENNG